MSDLGWFTQMTPDVIRDNPYLGKLFAKEQDMPRLPLQMLESSSLNSKSPQSLRNVMRSYMRRAHIILLTEMANNARRDVLKGWDNWESINIGSHGQDECAALVNTKVYRVEHADTTRISQDGVPDRGGKDIHALNIIVTRKSIDTQIGISTAHLRAHVEGKWDQHIGEQYREDVRNWRGVGERFVRTVGNGVLCGDVNLDMRRRWVRQYLNDALGDMQCVWSPRNNPITDGSHGHRLIDGFFTNMAVKSARLAPDDASSDHRPVEADLWIPNKRKATR